MNKRIAIIGLAATCAIGGTAAGITGAFADGGTTRTVTLAQPALAASQTQHRSWLGLGPDHVTFDTGVLTAVSGDTLTLQHDDGDKDDIRIPADADISRNGRPADLSDLDANDRVTVTGSDDGTVVVAFADDVSWFWPRP